MLSKGIDISLISEITGLSVDEILELKPEIFKAKPVYNLSRPDNRAEIKVILLKGSHLAQFVYKDAGLRPMGDIDIMVKKEDLHKAEELLLKMGYTKSREIDIEQICKVSQHISPFRDPKGIKHLEIHWTIVRPTSPFNIDIEGLWKRAKTVKINGTDVLVLSMEDLLLHITLHLYLHHFSPLGLKPFCDISTVVNNYAHEIDWDQLRFRACEWGTDRCLYLTLCLSKEILRANIPDRILDALKPDILNERIFLQAKKLIFSFEKQKPVIFADKFHPDNSLLKKISFIFQRIFISPKMLADIYSLPASSKGVYFYYFVRFISLIYRWIPSHAPFFLYLLTHKREYILQNNLDLWLISPNSEKDSRRLNK